MVTYSWRVNFVLFPSVRTLVCPARRGRSLFASFKHVKHIATCLRIKQEVYTIDGVNIVSDLFELYEQKQIR